MKLLSLTKYAEVDINVSSQPHLAKGFTLVEMMIIVVIVAILVAIAVPSYRQYSIRNAESQAQARMRQLQTELDTWRATNLTYRGFRPRQVSPSGVVTYAYTDTDNTQIAVPDATNERYRITLVDGGTGNDSLVPTDNTNLNIGTLSPNGWRMLAEPVDEDLQNNGASTILLTNRGLACKGSAATSITINTTTCPTGASSW